MGEKTSYRRMNPKVRVRDDDDEEKLPAWRKCKQGRNREELDEENYD